MKLEDLSEIDAQYRCIMKVPETSITIQMPPMVCWQVTLEDHVCYAYAATRSAAKWVVVSSWRDAGYGADGRWPSPLAAKRYPSRDLHYLSECRHSRCFSEDAFL